MSVSGRGTYWDTNPPPYLPWSYAASDIVNKQASEERVNASKISDNIDGSTPVKEQAVKEEGQKNVNEQASEEHAHPLKNDQWWFLSGGEDWRGDASTILEEQAIKKAGQKTAN